jgi:predicted DNA-binding transcriptional regulator YafY
VYIVSPYQMAATNGRYYLIGNRNVYPDVSNFRIDRISNIRLLDEPVTPMKNVKGLETGLNLPRHMAERIYMFTGEGIQVSFRAKHSLISDILDWFGTDTMLIREDDEYIIATVSVNEQAMFYWAMQYGENIEVLTPERLRGKIADAAKGMVEKYKKGRVK